jgi:hypothetical protein
MHHTIHWKVAEATSALRHGTLCLGPSDIFFLVELGLTFCTASIIRLISDLSGSL